MSTRDVRATSQEKGSLMTRNTNYSRNGRREVRILSEPTLRDIHKPEGQSLIWLDFALHVGVGSQWTVNHDDGRSSTELSLSGVKIPSIVYVPIAPEGSVGLQLFRDE